MKKTRINELARQLEVKPGVLLDFLQEMGFDDKKTHSSSIDEDVAEELRNRVQLIEVRPAQGHETAGQPAGTGGETSPATPAPNVSAASEAPKAATPVRPETISPAAKEETREVKDEKAPVADVPQVHGRAMPIRPPLAAFGGPRPAGHHAPSIPIPAKTVVHHTPAPQVAEPRMAAAPAVMRVAVPVAPAPSPAPVPVAKRTPAVPAAPIPAAAPVTPGPAAVQAAPSAVPAVPAAERAPVRVEARVEVKGAPTAAPGRPVPPPPARPILRTTPIAQQSVAAPPAPAPAVPGTPASSASAGTAVLPGTAAAAPAPGAPPAAAPRMPLPPRPPRPGQIISGPRQPLPGGDLPRPAVVSPGRPRPEAPRHSAPGAPRIPQPPAYPHQAPQPRQSLAGQPVSRPVVPPRPDLVARLQAQSQPKAMPGQPPAARPGVPMPGQPIYQGPPRRGPGQPMLNRPIRGRGPHPTTSPALVPPPPTEVARRDMGRKRASGRRREEIEGNQRMGPSRREAEIVKSANVEITISEGITVKELSEKLGIKAALVIKQLVDRKIFATINQTLDLKLAQELAKLFGSQATQMSYEEESSQGIQQGEGDGDRFPRPPVVTVMGHVDHGKTSLLDAIRETNVASREAGGITQHIGAYHVDINGRKIVFIDTPGHEAFTRMRARGAKVTDIVILVVAADDGVMPQTREAIDHAKAAKVPIIVAVNKIDKPDAQPERVKQQLTELGLMPEDWGGDTPFVMVSAKKFENIDLLLEMIVLVAEMQELTGNPTRPALATVLEAKLDRGRGPVATVLVRDGTLHSGDYVLCGSVFSRIRALMNDRGERVDQVGPSMPVELLGLDSLPEVGDDLQAVTDLAKARQIAEFREIKTREIAMAKTRVSLEKFHAQLREGESKELNLILKADVGGTAEVLADTLQKLSTEKVSIRVISAGVGAISESDVNLASASDAIIVGFNVRPERKAAELANTEKVDIRMHTVIYELTDEVKKAMVGMLDPVFKEVFKGRADVRDTFRITKVGTVAGCYVTDGTITRDCEVRLLRDNIVVHTGRVDALKRFKNDASEVKQGFECGISLVNYHDIKPGDILECFVKERVAQESLV